MSKIGRNDPCPCGSGKKLKKCCLAGEEGPAIAESGQKTAVQTALDWLHANYSQEAGEAVSEQFLGLLDDEEREALEDLPPEHVEAVMINIGEWLLTDARLRVDGRDCSALDLVLGRGGPLLTAEGRAWLQEIARRPMGLFEIRDIRRDEGLQLKNLLEPDEEDVWVQEKTASLQASRWDIIGARLARKQDLLVLTGGVYPMDRRIARDCLAAIEDELQSLETEHDERRQIIAEVIIEFWLEQLVEAENPPQIVDAASGEKIDLTTDRYQVRDWAALETLLGGRDDIEGNRLKGWTLFETFREDQRRILAELRPAGSDSLKVSCFTLKRADEIRGWLENEAGDALQFKVREVVDPRSEKAAEAAGPVPQPDIPPEIQRQMIHEYMTRHYQAWPEESLPALGGKTPLQAVKTPKGRQEVAEILKSFEQRGGRQTGPSEDVPFDFGFLWERLGLNRDDF